MTQRIAITLAALTGLAMIFLGVRFLLLPEAAEAGFGIHFNEQGDYAFHYAKGIRDIFSGLLLCFFALLKERRAVAITLLTGTIIPVTDMLIVLSKSYTSYLQAMPHIIAIITCAVVGIILLTANKGKINANTALHQANPFLHSSATNEK